MTAFSLILIYLAVGALLRRTTLMPDNTPAVLNAYVLYVAAPALILKSLPGLNFSTALLIPAITPWVMLLASAGLVMWLSRWLNWSRQQTGALLILVPLGNTSFLGFPLVDAFFGSHALPYAMIYDQLGSFPGLTIYATVVAAVFSAPAGAADSARPDIGPLLRKVLTFPPFLAFVLGLATISLPRPMLASSAIDSIAVTLVPVVMVAVGYQLSLRVEKAERSPLLWGLSLKLCLMPAVAWCLWKLTGQQGLAIEVSVFQAAMPSMISAGAIASAAGLAPRLVSGMVGLGILLSLVTLPVVFTLLRLAAG